MAYLRPTMLLLATLTAGPVAFAMQTGTAPIGSSNSQDAQAQAIENYIKFYEWHFELRLNPDQRQRFRELIIEDNGRNRLGSALAEKTEFMKAFAQSNWMQLFSLHSDMKQRDTIESAGEHTLNGGGSDDIYNAMAVFYTGEQPAPRPKAATKIYGTGTAAMIRHGAKDGVKSSQFLLDAVREYQKPLVGDGTVSTSLFKRDVDAIFEWFSIRSVMVAGKRVVQGDDQERALMQQNIVNSWNAVKNNPQQMANYRNWLNSNVTEWLMWRGADYSFFARQTSFGQKEQLARWGAELAQLSPQMKPYADQRLAEYRTYVAKMPDAEIKREYELKQKTDAQFQMQMQKMQNDMKSTAQSFAAMRQGLMTMHVANLNIAENIGNTGFRWEIRSQP